MGPSSRFKPYLPGLRSPGDEMSILSASRRVRYIIIIIIIIILKGSRQWNGLSIDENELNYNWWARGVARERNPIFKSNVISPKGEETSKPSGRCQDALKVFIVYSFTIISYQIVGIHASLYAYF